MAFQYQWHSLQGSFTYDNRDYHGVIEHMGRTLHIVLDGSTRGPNGGELAQQLKACLIKGFSAIEEAFSAENICEILKEAHNDLRHQFPADSASYLIMLETGHDHIITVHAGDCRLGKLKEDQSVEWLTNVHSLANAIAPLSDAKLAIHPNRHQLTRSFRSRGFIEPERNQFSLLPNENFLMVTDGFWAGLNLAEQMEFIEGKYDSSEQECDDISCLHLWMVDKI